MKNQDRDQFSDIDLNIALPPEKLIGRIGSSYRDIGRNHLRALKSECQLEPSSSILDLGCGCGRIAAPLTSYLDGDGTYDGLDLDVEAIEWCQHEIHSKYPNFRFQVADLRNGLYNRKGGISPEDYVFPYPDDVFDVVVATSVLTHLLPNSVRNYLREITRVLKKGGRSYITYFLINDDVRNRINKGVSRKQFAFEFPGYWANNRDIPEAAIAYDEDFIRDQYSQVGITIEGDILYGSWSGFPNKIFGQDRIIGIKQ